MAEVSAEVLADLMSELQNGKNFMQFIRDNNLQGQVRPNELRRQFVENFGQETLRDIMQSTMSQRMVNRWTQMAERMQDVEKVNNMITSFNQAIIIFQNRKTELEA
jgi:DNA-binding transcriptional regulator YbjK